MGGFSNIMKQIMLGPPGSAPRRAQQRQQDMEQQQIDLEKERQFRAEQESDIAFHNMGDSMNWKVVDQKSGLESRIRSLCPALRQ